MPAPGREHAKELGIADRRGRRVPPRLDASWHTRASWPLAIHPSPLSANASSTVGTGVAPSPPPPVVEILAGEQEADRARRALVSCGPRRGLPDRDPEMTSGGAERSVGVDGTCSRIEGRGSWQPLLATDRPTASARSRPGHPSPRTWAVAIGEGMRCVYPCPLALLFGSRHMCPLPLPAASCAWASLRCDKGAGGTPSPVSPRFGSLGWMRYGENLRRSHRRGWLDQGCGRKRLVFFIFFFLALRTVLVTGPNPLAVGLARPK